MRKLAPLTAFVVLAAASPSALADLATPEPAPEPPPKQDEAKKDEAKQDEAKQDEAKQDEAKQDEAKKDEAKKDEAKKSSGCSVGSASDTLFGLAALALVFSGVALRRRAQ
jgi:hypothetical protein